MDWEGLIPDDEWELYEPVIRAAQARGLTFVLGGGLAFSYYAGRMRNTKDLDLFLPPSEREAMVGILAEAGFRDYFDELPYDRAWIYRGVKHRDVKHRDVKHRDVKHRGTGTIIVDAIWQMANHYVDVDADWMVRGAPVQIRGIHLKLIPIEELIWAKLFILQRDRCDWPDLLNVLNWRAELVDWAHLLARLGPDSPLLTGLLSVFRWIAPHRATAVPEWVWDRLGVPTPASDGEERTVTRMDLLDTRDWFGPA